MSIVPVGCAVCQDREPAISGAPSGPCFTLGMASLRRLLAIGSEVLSAEHRHGGSTNPCRSVVSGRVVTGGTSFSPPQRLMCRCALAPRPSAGVIKTPISRAGLERELRKDVHPRFHLKAHLWNGCLACESGYEPSWKRLILQENENREPPPSKVKKQMLPPCGVSWWITLLLKKKNLDCFCQAINVFWSLGWELKEVFIIAIKLSNATDKWKLNQEMYYFRTWWKQLPGV